MEFSKKKLPKEYADQLRICPIHTVKPYSLTLAPMYVYMKKNEKFVAVKAPLDFFTPEELDRLRPLESFFMTEFMDSSLPFRDAGREVRGLLNRKPVPGETLPPPPYEISDAVLRIIGPLWSRAGVVEPFFVSVFVNDLCDTLPGELLRSARDQSVEAYEYAIFLSAWVVFLALHLGQCDLGYLNRLRHQVFQDGLRASYARLRVHLPPGADELLSAAVLSLQSHKMRILDAEFFAERPDRISQQITGRMKRVRSDLISIGGANPTIYGERGFIDG